MVEVDRTRLETALRQHYADGRKKPGDDAVDRLAQAMLSEDARVRKTRSYRLGHIAFVASQVRYIPLWTWAVQALFVMLMCMLAYAGDSSGATKVAVGMLSAMSVLVGVPTVQASKLHRVAELEYACPHNASGVLVARLIVLGCSTALAVALMVAATAASLNVAVFDVALWACPPFFLSCAGSLLVLRKASPTIATVLCAVWTSTCSATLLALANLWPDLYAHASLVVWAAAAAVACAWLVREVVMTLRAVSTGLDAFSPHLDKTYC